jgi:hypothetical protein
MNQSTKEFRQIVESWADARNMTKKELYRFMSTHYGRSGYWMDVRDREKIDADQGKDRIQDIEQYQCYDCEDRYPGLPFYTMIPSTVQEYGAFLCQFCFKGLEKKGFVPDQADDPRQIF